MEVWIKKLFVAIVAIMTLGLYVPPLDVDANVESDYKEIEPENKNETVHTQTIDRDAELESDQSRPQVALDPVEELSYQAAARITEKMGPRMMAQVDDVIYDEVIPNVETVINELVDDYDPNQLFNLELIEQPSPGYGEKIFDLYDQEQESIIAKFHIRRENKPQSGYWFNFHYHLTDDQFERHYSIGDVYWGKNTPPKWMS
ncbi:YpjP-like protein [Pelagirhabdus alkalitolerans]|uniref:YpjP-like protein n=1 Tax=Pelagirhabdus alkalitolerans TaxID=1612202 RepID=A0A1G6GKT4_9BACI|nr:YpjP family protein [Pelagirhabdus alkalitolerans]SDB82621.1 YpjP-like protein [Pelagirhabdus alkalitolerans]